MVARDGIEPPFQGRFIRDLQVPSLKTKELLADNTLNHAPLRARSLSISQLWRAQRSANSDRTRVDPEADSCEEAIQFPSSRPDEGAVCEDAIQVGRVPAARKCACSNRLCPLFRYLGIECSESVYDLENE